MAHIFQIPISFEFRTAKIQWEEARAHVIGWWNGERGPQEPVQLIAKLAGAGGDRTIKIPLSRVPEKERKQCLATVGKHRSDETVREICSLLELQYFVHNCKTYFGNEIRKHSLPADAWQLREDLLRFKGDSKTTLLFLNTWGRWVGLRSYVDLTEIADLQRAVHVGLTESPEKWFDSYGFPTMANSRSPKFPYFTMLTDSCEIAIRMATTIDLLRKIEFRKCARPDCPMTFAVRSKRNRAYCTQYCAHLESMRRNRRAAQRSE